MGPATFGCTYGVIILVIFVLPWNNPVQGDSTTYLDLFVRVPEMRMSTLPVKTFKNASVESCARACVQETKFECKSFDMDNQQMTCRLQKHTHDNPFVTLLVSTQVDHYRSSYRKLFHRLPNHIVTYDHRREVPNVSVEECSRRCILEMQFRCQGFDYEVSFRNCWMTDLSPQTSGGVIVQRGSDYYERKSSGPLENFINLGYGALRQLEGEHIYGKIILGVTLTSCAKLCIGETSFKCASFDYVFNESSCHLSQYVAANVYGIKNTYTEKKKTMHYEIKDEFLSKFYSVPYSAVLGHNKKTIDRVTPSSCARRCLQEKSFICRSFDYQTQAGTCLLSTKTGSDVGGLINQDHAQVHHFEMKPYLDCGGILEESEGTFASPNWPRNYSHNLHCEWNIIVPKYKVVSLDLAHFDLSLSEGETCKEGNDNLMVYDSHKDGENTVCITPEMKYFITQSNNITVIFSTNSNRDAPGFRIFYKAVWPCGAHMTEDNGQISSPGWPNSYPPNINCVWTIDAPLNAQIQLRFISIDLEEAMNRPCHLSYDVIEVFDGNHTNITTPIVSLCGAGDTGQMSFLSSENIFHIVFVSDDRVQKKGFHAVYRFIYPSTTAEETTAVQTLPTVEKSGDKFPKDIHLSLAAVFIEKTISKGLHNGEKFWTENATVSERLSNETFEIDVTREVPDITSVGVDLRQTIVILLIAFILIFIILLVFVFILCRHYRRRIPKRRKSPNFPFTEENDNMLNGQTEKEQDTEDINLPQPSSVDPLPDVSFVNPMYERRNRQPLLPKTDESDTLSINVS